MDSATIKLKILVQNLVNDIENSNEQLDVIDIDVAIEHQNLIYNVGDRLVEMYELIDMIGFEEDDFVFDQELFEWSFDNLVESDYDIDDESKTAIAPRCGVKDDDREHINYLMNSGYSFHNL